MPETKLEIIVFTRKEKEIIIRALEKLAYKKELLVYELKVTEPGDEG